MPQCSPRTTIKKKHIFLYKQGGKTIKIMTFPPSSYGYFTMVNLTKYFIIIIINYWGNGNFKEKNRKCPATKRGKIMSD
jgi:hypothetical protein